MSGLLIRGASLLGETTEDIRIRAGRIAATGRLTPEIHERVIDAEGLVALPGLVDLHTHLREPGGEASETVLTGTRAAAAGGYTAVFAMANTSPVADTAGVVEHVHALGLQHGYATVRPIGAVTVGLEGERLSEIGAMARSRAGVRVFSDDGKCVHDALLMRRALEYVATFDGVIAQHAQEPRLTEGAQMNEGALSGELGLAGWPAVAEESIIARDVLLAQHTGARLHICHLSTAGSVEVIRWAKARGIAVTAEVTPHHLLLTEELARGYDGRFKVNPPLRRDDDVRALREALADGTIDIVATDHAPHPTEAKECTWAEAAFGMVGLESALPVLQTTMIETGMLTWEQLARVMSSAPAAIGRLDGYAAPLTEGAAAHVTLVDPRARRTWSTDDLRGRSTNTPYTGIELAGSIVATVHGGVTTVLDGALRSPDDVAADARQVAERG
jgi:dihydroorotase